AFRALYERHAGWLAIRLSRRCNDRDLVADAVQDTFVAVWQKPRGFRGDGDIAAWLWGIAIRRLGSRRRTRSVAAARVEQSGVAPAAEDQALPSQGAPASRPSGRTVMTAWHLADDALRRYVERTDSLAEGASVEQHLLACEPCRGRVTAAASVIEVSVIDFAAVWESTRDAVEVPRPSVFERLLRAAGLPAQEARLVAVASAFRGVW